MLCLIEVHSRSPIIGSLIEDTNYAVTGNRGTRCRTKGPSAETEMRIHVGLN